MLLALHDELSRRGVRLLIARDVARVRDVLRRIDADSPPELYPTVAAAVAALTATAR